MALLTTLLAPRLGGSALGNALFCDLLWKWVVNVTCQVCARDECEVRYTDNNREHHRQRSIRSHSTLNE